MDITITHYTNNADTITKILKNGLAWVPNKRNLISSFISQHDFKEKEPQEFGMISFTDLPISHVKKHREKFGGYGIVMNQKWVKENELQKVIYIDTNGPLHDALSVLFNIGYIDLQARIKHPDDEAWNMAYTNKNMASVAGAHLWVNLLRLYEYLEPISNSYQQEWRIVQRDPLYGYKETKKEIIDNISPPVGWANVLNVLKINPEDVSGFICPKNDEKSLREKLPQIYNEYTIETY